MIENMIQISVIMSVYNEPIIYVEKAIRSILEQTFPYFEFIIVLDNPDNQDMMSFLETEKMQDERIILIVNNENLGLASSLNRGIMVAKGKYIARMDADDISKPDRLKQELKYIQEKNLDMIGCLADKIDENDQVWDAISPVPEQGAYIKEILPVQNIFIHPTVLMRKCVVEKLDGYRSFPSCQDYDLWLRMLTEGYEIGILNENLFCFRRHMNSITSTKHFIQVLNEKYIRNLYKERIEDHGNDSFSSKDLEQYLESHGAENEKKLAFERHYFEVYQDGIKLIKNHQIFNGICHVLMSLQSYAVRESIKTSIQARRIRKKHSSFN